MLPNRQLSSQDIIKHVTQLKISHFRGVFSRDSLPKKMYKDECTVINLANLSEEGSHWVAYFKKDNNIWYFDSFGDLPPPIELQKHFEGYNILYNYSNYQNYNTFICGHLCIDFLQCMNHQL